MMGLTVFWATIVSPIGAKGGGSKNGVNFGIFKNHSGGPGGGQITTDRSQIYTRDGESPLRNSAQV